MTEDIKRAVILAFKAVKNDDDKVQNDTPKPKQKSRSKKQPTVHQQASGSNIVQAGGNINSITINSTNKNVNVKVQPPQGTIGSNAFLVELITGKFNELGLRREERFGKTAYPVMYGEFKKDFSIPRTQKYTCYLLWPEARAEEILDYIQSKLDNTIQGRKQNSYARKGHSAAHLLGETRRLHSLLGWTDDEFRGHLRYLFGVTSRSELNPAQLQNYIEYLKSKIDA